jgi:glutathione-regulated potassium-efflux system ancillary protein KefC
MIMSVFSLSHSIVTHEPYSFLVAAVIASALVPTVISAAVFLLRHLLPGRAGIFKL